jgi:nucleoside-diphosphate kinase
MPSERTLSIVKPDGVGRNLIGEGAIAKNREVMGATDPKKAAKGTIRADLASSIDENIVHGSDAADTAAREISYFFREIELCPRTR